MPPSKNSSLLRRLLFKAESLASRVSKNKFPILLRPLAERQKVTSVDFCPLLVDAMLITHPEGFKILLNSDGGRTQKLRERYRNESKGTLLQSRLRFSIAHELAHTLFYDLTNGSPKLSKKFKAGGGRNELENLERHCNTIASHLLLPTQMLSTEFLRIKTITPESILELAQTTGVSLQALLLRLAKSDSLFIKKYFKGCIVLAELHGEGLKIRVIAKPKSLTIAHQLRLMRSNDVWNLRTHEGCEINPTLLPKSSAAILDVVLSHSKYQKEYKICVAEVGSFEAANSYLITFEEK
jgi:hypothetical protein